MWLRSRTCPILCTSDSNIAVDNLVDGLSRAGVRVARIGRPEAVRQDLMQYMVESIAGIEPGCNWSKDQQYQAGPLTESLAQLAPEPPSPPFVIPIPRGCFD